jgi:hypothetical protein
VTLDLRSSIHQIGKKIEPARVSQFEPTNVIVYFVAPKQTNKTSGVVIHTED